MGRSFGDRFGLIAFSGAAELMCPLTLDHGYYRTVLNAVDTDSISLEGTDLEAALDVATATFEDLEANGDAGGRDNRAVFLISDGEAVSGDAIAAAERLGELAHVFVMGVGDPRGTEVQYTNRFVQGDVEQQTHISRLDEDNLQRIALAGAGAYIRSTSSNRDVDELYGAIEQLFARSVDSDIEQRLVNRYQIPLAVAVMCFLTEGVWRVLLPIRAGRRAESTDEDGLEAADYA
jgi:Ca-activated chloride channel family protein